MKLMFSSFELLCFIHIREGMFAIVSINQTLDIPGKIEIAKLIRMDGKI